MGVIIVRSHLETDSPRVIRNAEALTHHGRNVSILVWDRECRYNRTEYGNGYKIHKIRLRAPGGPTVLPFLPIWWCLMSLWLLKNEWDVIHAVELDTIFPAIVIAKLKRKPVIYELNDLYEYMIPLPQIVRKAAIYIDRIFAHLADAVIVADEMTVKELNGIPNDNVVLICNSSPIPFKNFKAINLKRDDIFTIFHASELSKRRGFNLDRIISAVRSLDDVCLTIAGWGDQVEEIKKRANETPDKVQFIGRISYDEVLERTISADLLIALHDPTIPINRVSTSNKLWEAMMCGKPIIALRGTATAEVVEKEKCGLVLNRPDPEEIRKAIMRLKEDIDLCREFGANGRRAYEQKYSWEIMKNRLLALYQNVDKKDLRLESKENDVTIFLENK